MSAFKQLNRQDVFVSDYQAKKNWRASGSLVSSYGIEVLRGFSGSTPGYPYPSDYRNYRYESLVYRSARHLYYGLSDGEHTGSNGAIVYTGSLDVNFQTTLTLSHSRKDSSEVAIVSMPTDIAGTKIIPGTVVLQPVISDDDRFVVDGYMSETLSPDNTYNETLGGWYGSTIDFDELLIDEGDYVDEETEGQYFTTASGVQRIEIIDDGQGRLIISGAEAAFTREERQVGDVIYNHGNLIITDPIVARYYSTYANIDVKWKSNLPIYTYNVHCTVKESELNHTFNPSAITGSDNSVRDNLAVSSSFRPFITSIGLYNEANELIAVAKTNKPIPKSENVDMTFIVKLDI